MDFPIRVALNLWQGRENSWQCYGQSGEGRTPQYLEAALPRLLLAIVVITVAEVIRGFPEQL